MSNMWNKRSIFFDFPCWCMLDVRYCIDVMQVENNVCDSLLRTLLNIKGNTKDVVDAHLDMIEMNIQEKLTPKEVRKRTYLCNTLGGYYLIEQFLYNFWNLNNI